jgi:D-amino-acid dehydrogenase
MQKYIYANPKHACNRSILEYNMKCLYDPSDQLIQRIDYGRCAKGTKLLDGTIVSGDSSGDIGLFCQGLLHEIKNEYGDALAVRHGEEITSIEKDGSFIRSVISMDHDGNKKTIKADATVVACGIGSTHLCNTLDLPCPVFPAKGHLATVASKIQCDYNITLPGGLGYASPMAIKNSEGRYLYRLSGFVDFDLSRETNFDRIEALVDATRLSLPDVELIDASACHRPVSADDRPIVGCADKYSNLYLCSGFGSRGWSVGLGCGKLLSSIILGLNCEIDPAPFNPRRFR